MFAALIPALIEALGPMLAEGGAAAGAEAAGGAEAASTARAAAGKAATAGGPPEREVLTKLEQLTNRIPPGGGGGGGPGGPSEPPGGTPWKDISKQVVEETTHALHQSTRMANNDFAGMVANTEAIPEPIRKLIGAMDGLTKAVVDQTERLAPWDSRLMGASVNRQVTMMQADQEEAGRVGGNYARVTNAYTELEVSLREIFNPFKDLAADVLATLLEMVNTIRKFLPLQLAAEVITGILRLLLDVATFNVGKLGEDIVELPGRIAKALNPFSSDKNDDLMLDFWKNTNLELPQVAKAPPAPNAKDAPLGIKLIK